MKEKGFTLVELLAVIVILAIILIIAVPGVLSIINKTKDNAYDRQVDMIKEATRNYITSNTVTWNGDHPKSTLVTLDMLKSGGYLDKKLIDPRDKKEILCANVLVTKDDKNKITYDVDMTCNEMQPITPRVGSGMIPIVYDTAQAKWLKADASNKNFGWFNYGNQQWANVVTVTEDVRQALMDAPIGTEVPMDKINTMFVWLPRFKYKLFNVDGTVSPVGNSNMAGDYLIDIKFETASTTKSTGTKNGQWLTHPAFTFGGQELDGLWMAKFETGYSDATSPAEAQIDVLAPSKALIKPSVYSWRGIQLVNMYKNAQGMSAAGNPYGLTSNEDPHMAKNMEWGAMTYLTYSQYGKQGALAISEDDRPVRQNNSNQGVTGCGADRQDVGAVETCNTYDTKHGQGASTTGNITGIYDTSGGVVEFMAAVMKDQDGTLLVSSSGFDQTELNQLGQMNKYIDVYEYGSSISDQARGHLGDATLELGPFTEDNRSSWYKDTAQFISSIVTQSSITQQAWFYRGNRWTGGYGSGISSYTAFSGRAYAYDGARIVLI